MNRKNPTFVKYIQTYSPLAVEQMKKYHVPASITLAQGILESGAGQSQLARKSNNHFGIKCHKGWKGKRVYHNDDRKGECFRKYRKVKDSYTDHSKFLAERDHYSRLFKLDIKDYKGWCKGLQRCGYATDRAYANKLIKLIEDYELYRFDNTKVKLKGTLRVDTEVRKRAIYKSFGLLYTEALANDSYEELAICTGFKTKDLLKFNDVPNDYPLRKGDIVFLEKKQSKADKPHYDHVVEVGESMHSISQRYGIRLKNLYQLNKLDKDYVPEEGDVLKLR
jgi:hypothetical protein